MHFVFCHMGLCKYGKLLYFRSQQYERDPDGIAPLGEGYNEIDNFSLRKAGEKVISFTRPNTV